MKLRAIVFMFMCGALVATAEQPAWAEDPAAKKQLLDTRRCKGCDLSNADLHGAILELAQVQNAILDHANLYRANLKGADMTGARLGGTDLSGANLQYAKGAALGGAITNERTVCPNGKNGPCQ